MREKQFFWVNQNLEVAEFEEATHYKTLVQEVLSDAILVAVPMYQGHYFLPENGSVIQGRFVFDEALYVFEALVLGRIYEDNIPLIKLEKPQRLYRRQRRSYFRHRIYLDMKYMLLPDSKNTGIWYSTYTTDIGGGGIRFSNDKKLVVGTNLKIRLHLTRRKKSVEEIVEAEGRVVRAVPPVKKGDKHSIGLMFTEIQERQRDRIINFIFAAMQDKVR